MGWFDLRWRLLSSVCAALWRLWELLEVLKLLELCLLLLVLLVLLLAKVVSVVVLVLWLLCLLLLLLLLHELLLIEKHLLMSQLRRLRWLCSILNVKERGACACDRVRLFLQRLVGLLVDDV